MGRPDYIFGKFQETARCRDAQHDRGVGCAFAPQLVNALKFADCYEGDTGRTVAASCARPSTEPACYYRKPAAVFSYVAVCCL